MIGITDYLKVKRTESSVNIGEDRYHYLYDPLGLYSQVMKCTWWMPWQSEAMKDVIVRCKAGVCHSKSTSSDQQHRLLERKRIYEVNSKAFNQRLNALEFTS